MTSFTTLAVFILQFQNHRLKRRMNGEPVIDTTTEKYQFWIKLNESLLKGNVVVTETAAALPSVGREK